MDLKEIITRPITETENFTQEELEFVVEEYIKIRKNQTVKVVLDPRFPPFFVQDMNLLIKAFDKAREWLTKNL